MGRLEDMRRAAKDGPKPTPEPSADLRKVAEKPMKGSENKPANLPVYRPMVRFRCGHEKPLRDFQGSDCAGCRAAAKRAKAEARRARQASEPPAVAPADPGRLPAGAVKRLEWDGTVWRGTLTIPGCPETFTAEASGEKGCYHRLHDAWIAWRDENQGGKA